MSGIAGQFYKQFGLTVAVAVLFSLLVARLITPMMAAYFLRDGIAPEVEKDGLIMRTYLQILRWTLDHRTVTMLIGLAIFLASLFSATLLPTEFVPPSDTGRASISIELPPGSTLAETRAAALDITQRISTIPEVTNVFANGGSGSTMQADIVVNFGQKGDRDRSSFVIEDNIRALLANVPDLRITVLGEDGGRDIALSGLGDNEAAAAAAARELVTQINALPSVENASTSAALTRPEIQITPKPQLAAELGVTAAALAATIRIATIGDSGANVAKFNTGERQIPIILRLAENVRQDLSRMAGQRIPSATGIPIPLEVVATLELGSGPSSIERYDRQYRTSVQADLADGALLGPASAAVATVPLALAMPEGTSIQSAGDAEVPGEIFGSFALAMGAGILLV